MARVAALVPDLLFGSRVQADLRAGGHEVTLLSRPDDVAAAAAGAEVLVIDLTDADLDGVGVVEGLRAAQDAAGGGRPRTLGFFAHVDTAVRDRAQAAGFDLVVPRSRMAREGASLVSRLAGA